MTQVHDGDTLTLSSGMAWFCKSYQCEISAPTRSLLAQAQATAAAATSICYTGPRGGTYTISANGNKNYAGC